jgi:outer membrane protein assembly factor BamB
MSCLFFPLIDSNAIISNNNDSIFEISTNDINEKWSFDVVLSPSSSPVTADINTDGYLETLFGVIGGMMVDEMSLCCLDHNGDILWMYNSSGDVVSSPAVADLDADGNFEIIFGTMMGEDYLVCLDSQGQKLWNSSTDGLIANTVAVADINLDGYQEILFGATNDWFYCFDYTGSQVWNYTNPDITNLYGSPAIADIHSDNGLEVVFGFNGRYVYCLNSTGNLVYTYDHTDYLRSSPVIADLENDGTLEILFQANDSFNCLDDSFNLKWKYDSLTWNFMDSSPSISDIDVDGKFEVIITYADFDNKAPFIVCLNSTGDELWHFDIIGEFASPSVVGDLEDDNIRDIIFSDSEGHIYCLNDTGHVNWIHNITVTPLGYGHSVKSPALGDIDFDNVTEVIVGILNDNLVICLDFSGVTTSGISQWNCERGSMYHTGQMDRDGDFLDDVNEQFYGTLKDDWDTDDDLISDGREVFFGFDPLDPFDPYVITSPTPTSTSGFKQGIIFSFSITSLVAIIALITKHRKKHR